MLVHIVEDTEAIAAWLKDAIELHCEDCEVRTTTKDFGDLLDADQWGRGDVAVIDIMLGGFSGLDLVRYLSNDHPHVRTIVMTASLPSAEEATGMAHAVLVKPFGIDDLISKINTIGRG